MHVGHWWGNQKEKDQNEDQGVVGWIILKWIFKRLNVVVWTGLIWLL
jgi:hypothetical protein